MAEDIGFLAWTTMGELSTAGRNRLVPHHWQNLASSSISLPHPVHFTQITIAELTGERIIFSWKSGSLTLEKK